MDWQPIETANKRGGPYLLYDAEFNEIVMGAWHLDAWYEIGDCDGVQLEGVTHWLPLPSPPERKET